MVCSQNLKEQISFGVSDKTIHTVAMYSYSFELVAIAMAEQANYMLSCSHKTFG